MSERVPDIFGLKRKDGGAGSADGEVADDLGAFGWLRGVQDRALMLEIRQKDGRIAAKGYSWLQSADFDPSEGVTLNFSGGRIRISGRNLNAAVRPNIRLFAGILRHRVPWIQEANGVDVLEGGKDKVVI